LKILSKGALTFAHAMGVLKGTYIYAFMDCIQTQTHYICF